MSATRLYMTAADDERTITFDLSLDGTGTDLGSATIECHMRNRSTAAVTTVTDVTADADQVTYPGRQITEFTAAQLLEGVYTLEWEATIGTAITTYPGAADDRPILTIRAEAA